MGLADYRCLFSVIFSDFHLFDALYGMEGVPLQRARELLDHLHLSPKVGFDGKRFSTTDLSSGQRKRLALVSAILEDRDILLLDEVAADFDHDFREFFYRDLLPGLKARGKTILAVSHDDRYFGVADRVLNMEYGVLSPDGQLGRNVA